MPTPSRTADTISVLETRIDTMVAWASRISARVTHLEAEVKALRERLRIHESRANAEEVVVSHNDPRVEVDGVPTKRVRKNSAVLETEQRTTDTPKGRPT